MFQTYTNYEFFLLRSHPAKLVSTMCPFGHLASKLSGETAVSWKATLFKHNCSFIRSCCIFWSLTEQFFLHLFNSGDWWKISILKMVHLVHFLCSVSLQSRHPCCILHCRGETFFARLGRNEPGIRIWALHYHSAVFLYGWPSGHQYTCKKQCKMLFLFYSEICLLFWSEETSRSLFHWQRGDLESGQQFTGFNDLLFMYEHWVETTVRMPEQWK